MVTILYVIGGIWIGGIAGFLLGKKQTRKVTVSDVYTVTSRMSSNTMKNRMICKLASELCRSGGLVYQKKKDTENDYDISMTVVIDD